MIGTTFRVVLDANVLFPFTLRDTLLRTAHAGYFQVYWSEQILDETTRNLKEKGFMNEGQAKYLVRQMSRSFPEALVENYEPLINAMPNDEGDRHVAAAAVKAGAGVIVTNNLRHFRDLPDGIEALAPDEFLLDLLDLNDGDLMRILEAQAEALKNPPVTFEELLVGLSKSTPNFVEKVRELLES